MPLLIVAITETAGDRSWVGLSRPDTLTPARRRSIRSAGGGRFPFQHGVTIDHARPALSRLAPTDYIRQSHSTVRHYAGRNATGCESVWPRVHRPFRCRLS